MAARAPLGRHRLLGLRPLGRRLEPRRLLLVPRRREGGEQAAAPRRPRSSCPARAASLLTKPTTILLLGTDTRPGKGQQGLRHSDSMMLVRTDPDHHRLYYLSIPRDLYVDIPGYGPTGSTPRTRSAVPRWRSAPSQTSRARHRPCRGRRLPALQGAHRLDRRHRHHRPPRHPVQPLRVSRTTRRGCASWDGWRFAKGRQHMDGRRALVYSRIRENRLDPSDNDITRARAPAAGHAGDRRQARRASGTFLRLPFIGRRAARPLATDLSANQLLQLGWVKFRDRRRRSAAGSAATRRRSAARR